MNARRSMFRSPEEREEAFRSYDSLLGRWPIAVRSSFVATDIGETHVLTAGSEDAPPLILLHGAGSHAASWWKNVEPLAGQHRIYALDIPEEPGKSEPRLGRLGRNGSSRWLQQVLDGLGLDRVGLVGLSLGGWIALRAALDAPERVTGCVALAPAALIRMRIPFILRGMLAQLAPHPAFVRSLFRYLASPRNRYANDDRIEDTIVRWSRARISRRVTPLRFGDDELARLDVPTLILIGEDEVLYSSQDAAAHVARIAPQIRIELIPEAGHTLNFERPQEVNAHIASFLAEFAATQPRAAAHHDPR